MGTISLKQTDCLYWLGRYLERVYTTLQLFDRCYDSMIDSDPFAYREFCGRLSIPDIYAGPADFVERYLFAPENPDSIASNLGRAYDNAIVLRECISSLALSYVQTALDAMTAGRASRAHCLVSIGVCDRILSFWGAVDDRCHALECRNILKAGKHMERLNLYLRLGEPAEPTLRAYNRLRHRLEGLHLPHDAQELRTAGEMLAAPEALARDRMLILEHVERIL